MACTIDDTVGGASANAYCDVTYADAYHDDHPYSSTWDDASADEKCRAIVTATRLLDYWYEWDGVVSDQNQALLWPRSAVVGPKGFLEANDAIPERIKAATAEWARQLLVSDLTADSSVEAQGISSITAGPVSLTFQGAVAKPIPDAVQVGVSLYGRKRSKGGSAVRMYRG